MKERKWELEEAGEQLEEIFDKALIEGPQFIFDKGKKVAVMLSKEEYGKAKNEKK